MMIDVLSNRLSKGDRIEILGLGNVALNYKPPRQGRNLITGTKVMVLSKYVPHFNARKDLNGCVDKGGSWGNNRPDTSISISPNKKCIWYSCGY